ncbi:hypothetical protein MMC14_001439 [Varicellaria rhodocarpa]|nr:hypothetical protein [Varicellaria rhodocarpa]
MFINNHPEKYREEESPSTELDNAEELAISPERCTNMGAGEIEDKVIVYLKGWRLHTLTVALCLSLFMATLETTIVSTSLIAITNDLNGFQKSSWIVTSYLLTYSGFLIILSKSSDIFGRKPLIIFTVIIFTAFSAACGAAQTFTDLAILRAFQGIGGGGIYTLTFVISLQMVPLEDLASLSAILTSAYAFSAVLGPVLGGLISDRTTWRWVFYMNVPPGVIVLAMLSVAMPAGFPYQAKKSDGMFRSFSVAAARKVDFLGVFLLLAASILFVTAVQEGGTEYQWNSAVVLSLFCISMVLWILFFCWQKLASGRQNTHEPILPWRLLTDRLTMGFFLNALFGGAVFITVIIIIPQRFQVVNDLSSFSAGWRLLALMLCTPVASMLSGYLMSNRKIPIIYILLVGAILQIIGLALMGTLSISDPTVPRAQYGYQVILGFGVGLTLSSLLIAAPTVIEDKDTAVFVGALAQARIIGGSIGLTIGTNILNENVKSGTTEFLSSQQLSDLLQSAQTIKTLPSDLQMVVKQVFGKGYNEEMQALTGFSGAALLATLMMWEGKPRRMR